MYDNIKDLMLELLRSSYKTEKSRNFFKICGKKSLILLLRDYYTSAGTKNLEVLELDLSESFVFCIQEINLFFYETLLETKHPSP